MGEDLGAARGGPAVRGPPGGPGASEGPAPPGWPGRGLGTPGLARVLWEILPAISIERRGFCDGMMVKDNCYFGILRLHQSLREITVESTNRRDTIKTWGSILSTHLLQASEFSSC